MIVDLQIKPLGLESVQNILMISIIILIPFYADNMICWNLPEFAKQLRWLKSLSLNEYISSRKVYLAVSTWSHK